VSLPHTAGMGITLFALLAGLLVLAARAAARSIETERAAVQVMLTGDAPAVDQSPAPDILARSAAPVALALMPRDWTLTSQSTARLRSAPAVHSSRGITENGS
jgi:hypothetical protein